LLFEVAGYKPSSRVDQLGASVAEELLRIHKSYLKPIQALLDKKLLKGAAHITGGGLTDNVPRVLPHGYAVEIRLDSWPAQPIFDLLRGLGNLPDEDYRRTFNLGVGMVLIVPKKAGDAAGKVLKKLREPFYQIGEVVPHNRRAPRVRYV
jgi:phosphoribosylformylglycinamidine cyclo-ligase